MLPLPTIEPHHIECDWNTCHIVFAHECIYRTDAKAFYCEKTDGPFHIQTNLSFDATLLPLPTNDMYCAWFSNGTDWTDDDVPILAQCQEWIPILLHRHDHERICAAHPVATANRTDEDIVALWDANATACAIRAFCSNHQEWFRAAQASCGTDAAPCHAALAGGERCFEPLPFLCIPCAVPANASLSNGTAGAGAENSTFANASLSNDTADAGPSNDTAGAGPSNGTFENASFANDTAGADPSNGTFENASFANDTAGAGAENSTCANASLANDTAGAGPSNGTFENASLANDTGGAGPANGTFENASLANDTASAGPSNGTFENASLANDTAGAGAENATSENASLANATAGAGAENATSVNASFHSNQTLLNQSVSMRDRIMSHHLITSWVIFYVTSTSVATITAVILFVLCVRRRCGRARKRRRESILTLEVPNPLTLVELRRSRSASPKRTLRLTIPPSSHRSPSHEPPNRMHAIPSSPHIVRPNMSSPRPGPARDHRNVPLPPVAGISVPRGFLHAAPPAGVPSPRGAFFPRIAVPPAPSPRGAFFPRVAPPAGVASPRGVPFPRGAPQTGASSPAGAPLSPRGGLFPSAGAPLSPRGGLFPPAGAPLSPRGGLFPPAGARVPLPPGTGAPAPRGAPSQSRSVFQKQVVKTSLH